MQNCHTVSSGPSLESAVVDTITSCSICFTNLAVEQPSQNMQCQSNT